MRMYDYEMPVQKEELSEGRMCSVGEVDDRRKGHGAMCHRLECYFVGGDKRGDR